MRKTLGVFLFVLLLTSSTSAGIIPNLPPAPASPQPQTNTVQEPTDEATTAGEIQNDAPDSLTQTVLDLLAFLPSLL